MVIISLKIFIIFIKRLYFLLIILFYFLFTFIWAGLSQVYGLMRLLLAFLHWIDLLLIIILFTKIFYVMIVELLCHFYKIKCLFFNFYFFFVFIFKSIFVLYFWNFLYFIFFFLSNLNYTLKWFYINNFIFNVIIIYFNLYKSSKIFLYIQIFYRFTSTWIYLSIKNLNVKVNFWRFI